MKDIKHKKLCQCKHCVNDRAAKYADRIEDVIKAGGTITTLDATVPVRTYTVRAHMRRNGNHLNKDPKLKDALTRLLSSLSSRHNRQRA